MSTITTLGQVHTPVVIEGVQNARPVRTIVHTTLSGALAVTLRKAGPGSGRIRAVFAAEAPARALHLGLQAPATFELRRDDIGSGGDVVTFVPQGSIDIDLNTDVYAWIVSFDYVEVS